ncbi:hypothetical protein [Lewinella sp. IMCC34183]|uniref:hypothetical protein n=1 Tax=Lewinella sp. IMCC34183 TaxID=2248762 RepID=UPI000E234615|nr:hypothetical protein [Lewinella sp. IMCC34183]
MLFQYLLLALLFTAFFAPGDAQRSSRYLVTEITETDTYNLTVRLDENREADMLDYMEALTGQDLSEPGAETITAENDGINLTYLASRHMLVLSTSAPSADNADRAHRIGEELKRSLNIGPDGAAGKQ